MEQQAKTTRSRLLPEQRRAQLLGCAVSAAAEHGLARVTHAHVAKRAQVSVAAVHSYFRTRQDLVMGILGNIEASLMWIVNDAVNRAVPVRTALADMVLGFDLTARENSDVIKVWLDWSTGFRDDVWSRYLIMQERLHGAVRALLVRGQRQGVVAARVNITAAAQLFIGGGHTVALARFAGASQREIEILIEHLIESIMSIGMAGAGVACPRPERLNRDAAQGR